MSAPRLRAAVTLLTCACGVAAVRGYFIPNPERLWPDGTIEVHEQLGGPAGPLLDGSASLNAAFETAIDTWNQYLGRIRFVPVRGSTAQIGDGNDINNVVLSDTVFGRAFDETTLATTTRWVDTRTNRRVEFDITFNSKWNWNAYCGAWRADVKDVVRVGLQQLGFGIGLGSPDRNDETVPALMNSTVGDQDTLTLDDISGAISMYGEGNPEPPPAAPNTVRQYTARTDATGTATFTVNGTRTLSVEFSDEVTGAAIPGTSAYLFSDPNGVAVAALVDRDGRYFTRMAPVRVPVVPASVIEGRAVRPVQVPVPAARRAEDGRTSSIITDAVTNVAASAWQNVQDTAERLLNSARAAQIVVEREITVAELSAGDFNPALDSGQDQVQDFAVQVLLKKLGTDSIVGTIWEAKQLFGLFTRNIDRVTTYRDVGWLGVQNLLYAKGYTANQTLRVTIVRIPGAPNALRNYTESMVSFTALEEPTEDTFLNPRPRGLISGSLVDATKPEQRITGRIEFVPAPPEDIHGYMVWTSNGFFATKPIPRGEYQLKAIARGYRTKFEYPTVAGEGAETRVTIRMVPIGISRIDVTPPAQTIRAGQATSFRATAYGGDNQPYSPAPRIFWKSDNEAVATIDRDTGGVRAIKAGTARITASADQRTSNAAVLTVERSTPCAYTVSPTGFTSPAAGGSGTVNVTTESDCSWTAASQSSYITITSVSGGPGNGSVRFSVGANATSAQRVGSMLIATRTVNVTQSGTTPTPSPAPSPSPTPSGGFDGTYDFTYTFPVGGGQTSTRTLTGFFVVRSGRITASDSSLTGTVDSAGGVSFTGSCPVQMIPDPGSAWTGTMTASPRAGSGTYRCNSPSAITGTWRVANAR